MYTKEDPSVEAVMDSQAHGQVNFNQVNRAHYQVNHERKNHADHTRQYQYQQGKLGLFFPSVHVFSYQHSYQICSFIPFVYMSSFDTVSA